MRLNQEDLTRVRATNAKRRCSVSQEEKEKNRVQNEEQKNDKTKMHHLRLMLVTTTKIYLRIKPKVFEQEALNGSLILNAEGI
jgi:hypothetical protein